MSDVKLVEGNEDAVVIEGILVVDTLDPKSGQLGIRGTDLILDHFPNRPGTDPKSSRRALTHANNDRLIISCWNDYRGGVVIDAPLSTSYDANIAGSLSAKGNVDIGGSLAIKGNVDIGGSLAIKGSIDIKNKITFSPEGSLTSSGVGGSISINQGSIKVSKLLHLDLQLGRPAQEKTLDFELVNEVISLREEIDLLKKEIIDLKHPH
jgi:hypothetical protein